jgi:hypothetical protein
MIPNAIEFGFSKGERANSYKLCFAISSMITCSMGLFTFSIIALLLGNLTGVEAIIISFFAYPVILTKLFHENIKRLVEKIFPFL